MISEELALIEEKLKQAHKEGHIKSEYLPHQIQEAQKCGILKDKETTKMKEYHKKVFELLSVDDFDQKELGRH